jgi:hypothetical protein
MRRNLAAPVIATSIIPRSAGLKIASLRSQSQPLPRTTLNACGGVDDSLSRSYAGIVSRRFDMCVDGVSRLVMGNLAIQNLMSNPILDIVHKQVVMTLYSLAADHRLDEYVKMLPVYLSTDWPACSAILDTIEQAGLLTRTEGGGIALTYPIDAEAESAPCGCSL